MMRALLIAACLLLSACADTSPPERRDILAEYIGAMYAPGGVYVGQDQIAWYFWVGMTSWGGYSYVGVYKSDTFDQQSFRFTTSAPLTFED